MALTKRVSEMPDGTVPPEGMVVVSFAISELEIDERPALGRAEAEIKNHRHRDSDAHKARVENASESGFVGELIQPDQRDQQEHERGHLRRMPCTGENAGDNERGVSE